jgi:methionyl-tRNA synthetase
MNEYLRAFNFKDALTQLMSISTKGNQLLQYNEPWKLIKENPEATATIINLCLQYATALSVCCRPFMPYTSNKLRTLLNLESLKDNGELDAILTELSEGEKLIKSDHKINEPIHLFTRIENDAIDAQMMKLQGSKTTSTANEVKNPLKSEVSYDDFVKLDLRTATILKAEKVEKADKLLKLELDLEFEKRTVVSGIAEHYKPDEIIGQKVTLLANLAPRKIKGIESKGMILMASNSEGKLTFVTVDSDWDNGASIS